MEYRYHVNTVNRDLILGCCDLQQISPSFISQVRRLILTATPSIPILFPFSSPIHHFCNRNSHYALAQIAFFSHFGPGRPRMRDPEARLRFRSAAPFLRQGSDRNNFDRKFMLRYPALFSSRCNSTAPPHVAAVQGASCFAHSLDWTGSKCRCALEAVVSGLTSPVFEMLPSCR